MPYSRMNSRNIFINDDKNYQKEFFDKRDLKQMPQFQTGRFRVLSPSQRAELTVNTITWGATSSLTKLAFETYGSPEYWWVISLYNKKPLESDFKLGDTVYIPTPLEKVLSFSGV